MSQPPLPPQDDVIRQLSSEAQQESSSQEQRTAALRTGGVPVYEDMGGILIVMPQGVVMHYDPEHQRATPVTDERWRTVAYVQAARRFPRLSGLLPSRPEGAPTCESCSGTGKVHGVDCGRCAGLGWVRR
jgi:hypothetical protein